VTPGKLILPGGQVGTTDAYYPNALKKRVSAQIFASTTNLQHCLGAFIRRIKTRLGAPTAINAGAHKLAQLFYRMLKFGEAYVEQGQTYYEEKCKDRLLRNLSKRAKEFGLQLTPLATVTPLVS
jgi:transposase